MGFDDNIWRDDGRSRSYDRYDRRGGRTGRYDSRDAYDDYDAYDDFDDRGRSGRSSRNSRRDADNRSSRNTRSTRSGSLLDKLDSIDGDSLFADRDAGSSQSGSDDRPTRERSSRTAGEARRGSRSDDRSTRGARNSNAARDVGDSRSSSGTYSQRNRRSTYDPYDLYGTSSRGDSRSRRNSDSGRLDERDRYGRYDYDDYATGYGNDRSRSPRAGRGGDYGYDDYDSSRRFRGGNGRESDVRGRVSAGRDSSVVGSVKEFFLGLPAAAVDFAHAVVDRFGLVAAIVMGAVAIVLVTLLVSGLVGFVTTLPPLFGAGADDQAAQEEDETPIDEQALTDLIGSGFSKELVSAAENSTEARWIAAHPEEYASFGSDLQQKVIKLAATEPEAVHFARVFPYDYPASKPNSAADHVDSSKNGVPVLYQWDERWGFTEYDSSAFAFTGNFPTALSMVCQTIKGDTEATPYAIGQSLASKGITLTDGQLKTIPASEKQLGSSTVVETTGSNAGGYGEDDEDYGYDEDVEQVERYDEDGNYDVNGEYDADGYYIGSPYDTMDDGYGDGGEGGESGDSDSGDGEAKKKDAEKEAETVDSEPVDKAAKMLGLNFVELPVGELTLKEALKSQEVVLLYVGPGDFTETGHFVVATGLTEDGKVSLCDPFSAVRTDQDWDVNTLMLQTKAVYGFDRKQTTSSRESSASDGADGTGGANGMDGTSGTGMQGT